MKIKSIRISGFRGIPPIDPYGTSINVVDNADQPRNLVLFGPNAYGKSSIADALEWLFKERARGSLYFEDYHDSDNVHLNLGKPNFRSTAIIEVDILHNGQTHKVRKELDVSGHKVSENLDGLDIELHQAEDEIVILDHDQFREFVNSASKEKWATFSGLIGYEELDHFRSGLVSLTGRSLTDSLEIVRLEADLQRQRNEWQRSLTEALRRYKIEGSEQSLHALQEDFLVRLQVTAASVGIDGPTDIEQVSDELFEQLRMQAKPTDAFVQAAERFQVLQRHSVALQPLVLQRKVG